MEDFITKVVFIPLPIEGKTANLRRYLLIPFSKLLMTHLFIFLNPMIFYCLALLSQLSITKERTLKIEKSGLTAVF